jgi:hypothetical protein
LSEASYWTKQGLWPLAGNSLAVEDVFSTYLYTGNSSTQTITNGIDLAGKGGLVWRKSRAAAGSNVLIDTSRGIASYLVSNLTDAAGTGTNWINSFNSNGFTMNANSANGGTTYTSWTFREAPNFFDVVTWTGDGTDKTINHNLGVAPGMICIKKTNATGNWWTYHRSLGLGPTYPNFLYLNTTGSVNSGGGGFFSGVPTSSQFFVGPDINTSGDTFVAYLYAHDTSSDGIIQCGIYTGAYPASPTVTLGWEPQWVMIKSVTSSSVYTNWGIWDNMRGMPVGGNDPLLDANRDTQEGTTYTDTGDYLSPTATGFIVDPAANGWNINNTGSVTYIYMAIRRGPMRTPTLGTSVYNAITTTGTGTNSREITGYGFNPDFLIFGPRSQSGYNRRTWDRLRNAILYTDTTASEAAVGPYAISSGALQDGYIQGTLDSGAYNQSGTTWVNYGFGRAPGFFDEVCYTGTGAVRTVTHNLGVVPELMIVKKRDATTADGDWAVWNTTFTTTNQILILNSSAASTGSNAFNSTQPTSSVFTTANNLYTNLSGSTYVAYLFASVPGVSKVGSYTGTGALQTVNCAFTTGARFVLIKRTDSTGDWYVWNSATGITSGNDPYLLLNTTAAEETGTNYVDTDPTGFKVTAAAPAGINANGGTYIFLAIA